MNQYYHTYKSKPGNQQKLSARWKCKNAIRRGRLTRQPCEKCGAEKTEAHHDDYTKPLDVRWLCKTCHTAIWPGPSGPYTYNPNRTRRPRLTHCARGHEMTGHNVLLTTRGDGRAPRRKCRACTKLK